ncbi:MAG: hypothetical protein GWN84_10865 [Gammaproteobacteria bacterium]|nr:hypothetical protein [Gammaproteobacteria bacterium]NIR83366.1 hypothetical protein [Gammaproteobacteria bacterium]NIR91166.1 hypothetical protein [Gammaproteobacteria bacterium]NIU04533.1 hypothetical protein [Gammaproteobacteria bacterium]NIW87169.1 hypothetical protein [Gammaproteobacteria bacterium]
MTDTPDSNAHQPAPEGRRDTGVAGGAGASRGGGGRGTLPTLLVLTLLTMAGAAGGGYWLWEQLQASRAASQRLEARWEARAQGLEQRLAEAQARQRTQTQARLETLHRALAAVSESLGALEAWAHAGGAEGVEPRAWSLAQAKILLLTAAYQSSAHQRERAARTLEAASARLAVVDDPRLDPVRERLAADLEALRESPYADLSRIAAALSGLAREAQGLPLPSAPSPEAPASGAPPAEEAVGGWRGVLDAVWRNAKGLIVVRRVAEDSPAGWLPQERLLMRARVHLALDGARLAALRRDTEAFRAGLRTAREWLLARFDAGTPQVQAMVQRIEALEITARTDGARADPLEIMRLLERTLDSSALATPSPRAR